MNHFIPIFLICVILFGGYMLIRNEQIYRMKMNLTAKVHQHNVEFMDTLTSEKIKENYDAVDKLYTYQKAFYQFWKPVKKIKQEIIQDMNLEK